MKNYFLKHATTFLIASLLCTNVLISNAVSNAPADKYPDNDQKMMLSEEAPYYDNDQDIAPQNDNATNTDKKS